MITFVIMVDTLSWEISIETILMRTMSGSVVGGGKHER